jgi:hypothetical protein
VTGIGFFATRVVVTGTDAPDVPAAAAFGAGRPLSGVRDDPRWSDAVFPHEYKSKLVPSTMVAALNLTMLGNGACNPRAAHRGRVRACDEHLCGFPTRL